MESLSEPSDHRSQTTDFERSSTAQDGSVPEEEHQAVNHALIKGSRFIHQTSVPVFLDLKDTEVPAYRTDPVQVRS